MKSNCRAAGRLGSRRCRKNKHVEEEEKRGKEAEEDEDDQGGGRGRCPLPPTPPYLLFGQGRAAAHCAAPHTPPSSTSRGRTLDRPPLLSLLRGPSRCQTPQISPRCTLLHSAAEAGPAALPRLHLRRRAAGRCTTPRFPALPAPLTAPLWGPAAFGPPWRSRSAHGTRTGQPLSPA